MKRSSFTATMLFVLFFVFQGVANDWGKTGHRATGEIAEAYLKRKTKRKIKALLEGQSLAYVSNYADDIKSDQEYRKYGPWHYVNFPFDKNYGEETPSEFGDLIQAIEICSSKLKDADVPRKEKQFYLKMLVHFVGDLHQPLHVGRAEDKGGNDIQVRWFTTGTNLHRVWDSDMLDYYGMSYTELSITADRLSKRELEEIEAGTILDWVHESRALAKKVYASASVGEKLSYRYMYDYFPIVRMQLQKGGIRLAKILNEIFQ
ncbi:S1/P1 nuclease [Aquimarina hainanensis]|uniref:S1/P1 nuclease n=1 Tax=Aquimarina hainanensis TaxID=1578017 RepID=A0ABW5NAF2_9FLAO|nr:S1/P1 nuclease [Aquimarina sp. TRL1]QKX05667.1 S1/P1 nuclease [Aquimarina sp. TRL1]